MSNGNEPKGLSDYETLQVKNIFNDMVNEALIKFTDEFNSKIDDIVRENKNKWLSFNQFENEVYSHMKEIKTTIAFQNTSSAKFFVFMGSFIPTVIGLAAIYFSKWN